MSTADDNRTFSFADPMPSGRLVIQASAGTGKTFALAGLATRFIAEGGVPIAQLLIVTFTRAATDELRSRVRQRMVDTAERLSGGPGRADQSDPIITHLLTSPDSRYIPRLQRAISDFDSATITTIHGFATQVLGTLGTMSGIDPDSTLVDGTDDLTFQTCADIIASHAAWGVSPDRLPPLAKLTEATTKMLAIPGLCTVPEPTDESIDVRSRTITRLAREATDRVIRRRAGSATMSFDDILVRLRDAISGPGAASVTEALRNRFRVALIDEFQDTDPVQWDIFRILFGQPDSDTSLVLVGDPKQAIYSFRGADITTYLHAVESRTNAKVVHRSLATNWRSDGAMLGAIETLLTGATFGDTSIRFTSVKPAPDHESLRIRTTTGQSIPALSIRLAVGPSIRRTTTTGAIQADAARSAIYDNLAHHIGELLASATIPDRADNPPSRRVRPSDIAVLTLNRSNAEEIRRRLVDQGIPAVLARGSSVLHSPAAKQWRWLLNAMARPSEAARARAFALSWFYDRTVQWIHDATDDQIAELQELLQTWSETLSNHGLAPAIRQIRRDTGVTARVLSRPDGDRDITDFDHVAELLQTAYADGAVSPSVLLASLDSEPDTNADTDIDGDVTSRRVKSEADAVQIMTVWVAKGLEFPIVCVPTLWAPRRGSTNTLVYHDPITGERTFDVASVLGGRWQDPPRAWPSRSATVERRSVAADEAVAEDLRLLYVALTRARHHTIVWWSHGSGSDRTAISRVLFARTGGVIDETLFNADRVPLPADDDLLSRLDPLVDMAHGTIEVRIHGADATPIPPWQTTGTHGPQPELKLAKLRRFPDRGRGRWSFTAIVNRADYHADPHDPSMSDRGATDEPVDSRASGVSIESDNFDDVGETTRHDITAGHRPGFATSSLATLPAGTEFGTLVHEVLEEVDFTSNELRSDLTEAIHRRLRFGSLDLRPVTPAEATRTEGLRLLVDGIEAAIYSPLGPLFDGINLSDINRTDRLDEMSFELLLGRGSDRPTDRDIGRLVHDHLPPDDPLREWAANLADGIFGVELAGHLTGSIDALLRVRDSDATPRFVVVDYKSNRLHDPSCLPRPGDYSQSAMATAMARHHYGLQALLYSVATHRYLRWRLPHYDPAVNLGGVAYLFVRGMAGPEVATERGVPDGVFTWSLPSQLVIDLSDLLHGKPEWNLSGGSGPRIGNPGTR